MFQSESGQDASACQISGHSFDPNPKIWHVSQVKILLKIGKTTDHNQNLISFEDGHDTL